MKCILALVCAVTFCHGETLAQGFGCETSGTLQARRSSYHQLVGFLTEQDLLPYDPSPNSAWYTIGIALHIVRFSDGSGGVPEATIQEGLLRLSNGLAPARVSLLVVRRDTIDDDAFAVLSTPGEADALAATYNVPYAVNVYYVPQPGEAGLATFSPPQMNWWNGFHEPCARNGQYILIESGNRNYSTLAHEVGHYFDLFHTFEIILGSSNDFGNNYSYGDLCPDTPIAIPDGSGYNCNSPNADERALAENFMSGRPIPTDCRSKFTPVQMRRIRYSIARRREDHLKDWIQLTNVVAGFNAGGRLKVTQASIQQEMHSGQFAGLTANQLAQFKTLNERLHYSSQIFKHRDWNQEPVRYTLESQVSVLPGIGQDAWFHQLHPVTIRTEFIDGGSGNGQDSIRFRDPWYLHSNGTQPDDFFTYPSPFSPTGAHNQSSGGVFLGQFPDPQNPNVPYYRVHAPSQPPINNFNWHFIDWKTTGTTQVMQPTSAESPVIFGNGGEEVIARYKAHLGSSLASATGTNSQRKLSADFGTVETNIALCYASGGEIWLSESNGWEAPFAAEERVSDGTGGFGFPSLVAFGRADELDYPLGFAYIAPWT